MIKLTGNVSRKVPVPGVEYSSQSFGAGMEMEVGNNASSEEIRDALKRMYDVLEESVKAQIISNGVPFPESGNGHDFEKPPEDNPRSSNGDPITPNQKKLISKLVREQEIFGKERIRLLEIRSKEEASEAIKNLLAERPQRR